MKTDRTLKAIEQFLDRTNMAPTTLGRNALNDSHAIQDFMAGKRRMWPETVEKLHSYMASYRSGAAA